MMVWSQKRTVLPLLSANKGGGVGMPRGITPYLTASFSAGSLVIHMLDLLILWVWMLHHWFFFSQQLIVWSSCEPHHWPLPHSWAPLCSSKLLQSFIFPSSLMQSVQVRMLAAFLLTLSSSHEKWDNKRGLTFWSLVWCLCLTHHRFTIHRW